MRFTVHESPDYQKMKVSVFNDDKKSEIIGEGWIDLTEVVVAGGGQSDKWQELSYRGRYAGEVRVELTYYDSRPRDETVIEKRKDVERKAIGGRENTPNKASNSDAGRQLGPRDIKRRPLPADPTGSSPLPARPQIQDHAHSSPGPYLNQVNDDPTSVEDSWHPPPPGKTFTNPSTPNNKPHGSSPFDFELPSRRQGPIEYPKSFDYHDPPFQDSLGYDSPNNNPMQDPDANSYISNRQTYQPPPPPQSQPVPNPPFARQYDERRHSAQPTFPSQDLSLVPSSPIPYRSSPPVQERYTSLPGSAENRQRIQFNRYSTSPIKNDIYRDSPLKQSVSHSNFEPELPDATFDDDEDFEDGPPPPPPVHRFANSRPVSNSFSQPHDVQPVSMPEPQHIGPSPTKSWSLDDRSPLQSLERQYDPRISPNASQVSSANGSAIGSAMGAGSYMSDEPSNIYDAPPPAPLPRPRGYSQGPMASREPPAVPDPYDHSPSMPLPNPMNHYGSAGPEYRQPTKPLVEREREIYGSSGKSPISDREREIYGPGGRNSRRHYEPNSPIDGRGGMHTSASVAPVVRPRAISPDTRGTIRKSVSPGPSVHSTAPSISGTPFSPDSYDVFNPANSADSAQAPEKAYDTREQAMEAARQKEVQKLREQGPIIGNDGREIDPSDHLPADTWAPEPERKKKPEVVIRFKTGGTPRTPNGYGSSPAGRPQSMAPNGYGPSPVTARPRSMASPNYGNSPAPIPIHSSPADASPIHQQGRNRLQKAQRQRPSPHQPYQHANSSPAVPFAAEHASPTHFDPPPRNAASEYPLREHQNYGNKYNYNSPPRNSAGNNKYAYNDTSPREPLYSGGGPPPRPAKVPLQTGRQPVSLTNQDNYGGFGRADALAAELSTIDIGMGSGGRYGSSRPRRNW